MRRSLLDIVRCPHDHGVLDLDATETAPDDHVMSGKLVCRDCGREYKIEKGVPHLLPDAFANKGSDGSDISELQENTRDLFGYEWEHYRDWGWLDSYPEVEDASEKFLGALREHSKHAFQAKSMFREGDLTAESRVLDAGCGNGRFCFQASVSGAEVVGVDLSWSVFAAFNNTRHLSNVHIVRGDLFQLPFAAGTFDAAFSIGVLHHTGNAKEAFRGVANTLRPDGVFGAHLYAKGNPVYEWLDDAIRRVTTRLNVRRQMQFAKFTAWIAHRLRKYPKVYGWAFRYMNLLPTDHHMFDWWAAPIATHHTPQELKAWCDEMDLGIAFARPTHDDPTEEQGRFNYHGTVGVLAQKR